MCDLNLSATNLSQFKRKSDIFLTVIANFPIELILVLTKCCPLLNTIIDGILYVKQTSYLCYHALLPRISTREEAYEWRDCETVLQT